MSCIVQKNMNVLAIRAHSSGCESHRSPHIILGGDVLSHLGMGNHLLESSSTHTRSAVTSSILDPYLRSCLSFRCKNDVHCTSVHWLKNRLRRGLQSFPTFKSRNVMLCRTTQGVTEILKEPKQ